MTQLTHARLLALVEYNAATGAIKRRSNGRVARPTHGGGYVQIMLDRKMYLGHRLAWFYAHGRWPDGVVDHINADPSDNRIGNLRDTTRRLNVAHSKKYSNNTSGFKGVSWNKQRRAWAASICVHSKTKHLGMFDTPEAAHSAYMAAARQHFGEFARAA